MSGKWKMYPAYRESGVEWLGPIPKHWRALKIKRLALVKRGASPRPIDDPIYFSDSGSYAWVRISDVTASNKYLCKTEERLSSLGQSKSVALEPGEIFLSIAATVGKPIITKIRCCIHDGFVYFVGLKENREFLYWLFSSGGLYKGLGKQGTQLNLNTDTIGDIRVPIPPQQEQHALAAFLDRETAKIDALVAKKERLIELLQEKRTALISHAVTRGLNTNAPLRDSGIPWIGRIPVHWEGRRAKHLCSSIVDCKNRTPNYFDNGEYVVVRTTDVKDGRLLLDEALRTDHANFKEWTVRGAPQSGDVLFTREAPAGEAAIFDGTPPICLGQRMMLLRANPTELEERFLLFFIYSNAAKGYILSESGGSTVSHLRLGQVYNFPVPQPPVTEQRAIADYLELETAKLDALTTKIRTAIDRLQEYRTALISAAVTGQIDVRKEAA